MKRPVLTIFVSAVIAATVSTGCPDPMNTVLIENQSSANVVFVGVLITGRQDERMNLLATGEVIPPGFSEPFCCFFNDFYDIFVLTDEPTPPDSVFTEYRFDNQPLIGPMTHVFSIEDLEDSEGEGAGEAIQ